METLICKTKADLKKVAKKHFNMTDEQAEKWANEIINSPDPPM